MENDAWSRILLDYPLIYVVFTLGIFSIARWLLRGKIPENKNEAKIVARYLVVGYVLWAAAAWWYIHTCSGKFCGFGAFAAIFPEGFLLELFFDKLGLNRQIGEVFGEYILAAIFLLNILIIYWVTKPIVSILLKKMDKNTAQFSETHPADAL